MATSFNSEKDFQNQFMIDACAQFPILLYRQLPGAIQLANGGFAKGLPNGASDIGGTHLEDGKSIQIEIKLRYGKFTTSQINWLEKFRKKSYAIGLRFDVTQKGTPQIERGLRLLEELFNQNEEYRGERLALIENCF